MMCNTVPATCFPEWFRFLQVPVCLLSRLFGQFLGPSLLSPGFPACSLTSSLVLGGDFFSFSISGEAGSPFLGVLCFPVRRLCLLGLVVGASLPSPLPSPLPSLTWDGGGWTFLPSFFATWLVPSWTPLPAAAMQQSVLMRGSASLQSEEECDHLFLPASSSRSTGDQNGCWGYQVAESQDKLLLAGKAHWK